MRALNLATRCHTGVCASHRGCVAGFNVFLLISLHGHYYLLIDSGYSEANSCTGEHLDTEDGKHVYLANMCIWQTLSASHLVADYSAMSVDYLPVIWLSGRLTRNRFRQCTNISGFYLFFCIEKPSSPIIQESCLLGKEEKASSGK